MKKVYDVLGTAIEMFEKAGIEVENSTDNDAVLIVYDDATLKEELDLKPDFMKKISKNYPNKVKFEDLEDYISELDDEEEEDKPAKKVAKKADKKAAKPAKKVVVEEDDEDEEEDVTPAKKAPKADKKAAKPAEAKASEEDEDPTKSELNRIAKTLKKAMDDLKRIANEAGIEISVKLPRASKGNGKTYSADMPNFAELEDEAILKMAKKAGFDDSKYEDDRIKRMRAVMFMKKSYEV